MTTTSSSSSASRITGIIAMFFLFAMISFVTNLAAPIGTIWSLQFPDVKFLGMLGNMMNFLAYLVMGIPAGILITKIGFKKTALWAIVLGFVGLGIQWLSSFVGTDAVLYQSAGLLVCWNFIIYLLGAFICGFCVCMLNTVVNPMLNLLGGGGSKGNQLLQTGGSLNSLAATLTPFLVGALIGNLTPDTEMSVVAPLLWIAMGIFLVAFFIISFINIPEPDMGQKGKKVKDKYSPWNFRHTVLGVISIFFYVGAEVGIPATLIYYLSDTTPAGAGILVNSAAVAGAVAACYWLLMLVGRLLGSAIGGWVNPRIQLTFTSLIAICLIIGAIILPASSTISVSVPEFIYGPGTMVIPISALLLVLCGLCTSIMWGCIFNLATEGLGKYTAKASGIFMMMVVGGGVMPLIQSWLSGVAGYMASYWLVIGMFGFILFFALVGSRNVNKNIPVNDDTEEEIMDAL